MRVLIVDDEALARRGLRRALEGIPEVEIVGECANGVEAVSAIVEHSPDLVLLDVQMPGLSGFGVIDRVGADAMPPVIFVTAHDRHALKAFEVHALDYVLKPVDPKRLREAVLRAADGAARRTTALERLAGEAPAGPPLDRIVVRDGDRLLFVETAAIDWIEAAGNYTRLHAGAREHLIRGTLERLAGRLAGRFVRIRRSALINAAAITSLSPYGRGSYSIELRGGARLVSSRHFLAAIRSLLDRSS